MLHQLVLRRDHVANRKFREFHPWLRAGIARGGGETIPDRVRADDEILGWIERLAWTDHEIEPVVIAADRSHHQDHVGFFRVQRSVCDVGDREILDYLAAFQSEIADAVELVRRLVRPVCKYCVAARQKARE